MRGVFSGLGQSAAVPATTTATGSGSEAANQQEQLLTRLGSEAPGDLSDQSAAASAGGIHRDEQLRQAAAAEAAPGDEMRATVGTPTEEQDLGRVLLWVPMVVTIDRVPVKLRALVDSGSSVNGIRKGICSQQKFRTLSRGSLLSVKQPDGTVLSVGERIPRAHVRVGTYSDTMQLDVVPMEGIDLVLGKTWLTRINPHIDWQSNQLTFRHRGRLHQWNCSDSEQGAAKLAAAPKVQLISSRQFRQELKRPGEAFLVLLEEILPDFSLDQQQQEDSAADGDVDFMWGLAGRDQVGLDGGIGVGVTTPSTQPSAGGGGGATVQQPLEQISEEQRQQQLEQDIRAAAKAASMGDPALVQKLEALLLKHRQTLDPISASQLPPEHRTTQLGDVELEIEEVPGSKPVRRPAIKLNPAELEELKRVLKQLLDAGHIRPSSSSYAAPVMFVKKPDGGLRFVADYRMLNKQTVRQAPQIPRIDEIVQRIVESKCLTKLDLVNGYWQVRMAEGSVAKTCITTRYGNYEWLVMPMGLSNAPSAWMKLMNSVLHPVLDRCCIVYMDDLLVYSQTPEQHLKDLDEVLGLLGGAHLACKPSKCSFAQRELTYVGFRVSGDGVAADPAKVAPIRDWPTPTTPHQVRQFVGLANYYRRFIRHFADIAKPLYLLLKGADSSKAAGSKPFPAEAWGEQQQRAFQKLKEALTSTPVLAIYDPANHCRVTTDASDFAVGGVIKQLSSDDKWHPVAYASRALNAAEQNYHTTERENLALVYCLEEWEHMLVGSPHVVLCQTDHDALKDLLTKPTLSRREARWVTMLADYQLRVVHIPGSSNAVGDPLSRRPDYAKTAPKDGVPDGIKLARRFGLDLGDDRVGGHGSSSATASPSPLLAALAVSEVQLAAAAVAVKQDVAFLRRRVRRAYQKDPQVTAVIERLAAGEVIPPARQYSWELTDGLLWRVGPTGGRRLYLPADSELQLRILQQSMMSHQLGTGVILRPCRGFVGSTIGRGSMQWCSSIAASALCARQTKPAIRSQLARLSPCRSRSVRGSRSAWTSSWTYQPRESRSLQQ